MEHTMGARSAIVAAEKERGREYTPRQKKFLTVFAKNEFKDIRGCAEEAGVPAKQYHRFIQSVKSDIEEVARSMLLGAAPEAAMGMIEVMNGDGGPQASTRLAASKEVLDRVGIVKEEKVNVDHHHTGGIFIIPAKAELPEPEYEEYEDGEWEEIEAG